MTSTIATIAEPETAVAVALEPEPRCEAMLQCAEQCCQPQPCDRPAAARVSFACRTPTCDRASHVLLLCADCADVAAAGTPPPTRRPL